MNVTRVNESYIFYDNETMEETTETALREILSDATREKIFYNRMHKELGKMYNKAKLNFDHGTPAPDRDNYFERVGALSGLSDAMAEADKKQLQALQIETQCLLILGIDRPNINEMYPETRLKK